MACVLRHPVEIELPSGPNPLRTFVIPDLLHRSLYRSIEFAFLYQSHYDAELFRLKPPRERGIRNEILNHGMLAHKTWGVR
jgi:hypothetical protein